MFSTKKRHLPLPTARLRKRTVLFTSLGICILMVGLGIFAFIRINTSLGKTFQGSAISSITGNDPLKQDTNGVTNTLIFGNSSDDPNHGGALLADSIMVLSINNRTGSAHTISIPRDLWVAYGRSCSNGSEGKINAYYQCVFRQNGRDEQQASEDFAKQVGEILDIPMHYYAKVNYTFVRDSVNALGGIDVVIQSNDPRGILDRTFDKNCPGGPYTCYNLKYENGPVHLDGEHALYLSRARNAKGGYGLPQSNFDREVNQQLIVEAIQKKALTAGVLANPVTLLRLVDSLGNTITTNIKTSELQSVRKALEAIGSKDIQSIALNETAAPLVTTGTRAGQSIVLPTAGLYNYQDLRTATHKALAR